jgi:hypothetical protein
MSLRVSGFLAAFLFVSSQGQAQSPPNVSQVLIYSATTTANNGGGSTPAFPGIFSETKQATDLAPLGPFLQGGACNSACVAVANTIGTAGNYTVNQSFASLIGALNGSIATALSIVPLASPASGVIFRRDPQTGLILGESSTLGPIFTERAETIGKGKFYIGFSNQDYHFTHYNGSSLNSLSVFYSGGQSTALSFSGTALPTTPAIVRVGMDVRLSQDITFLTYGVTDRFDISVGLPVVHSAVAAQTFGGVIYAGNGFGNPTCWCANTFTAGSPTLLEPVIGQASYGKTGFGDLLVRGKVTVLRTAHTVVGVGADVRFPTGDVNNYLGVGTTTVKPFAALSFYTKPFRNGIVLSPHLDAGWQFAGQSILAGQLQGTSLSPAGITGAPFSFSKAYLPGVFSWAGGAEIALGNRSTIIADILGNEIGWIHGIQNTTTLTLNNLALPTGPNGTGPSPGSPPPAPTIVPSVSGLIAAGRTSYGQYNGSFGYKARVAGNLIAYFDALIRLDNNGLTARFTPLAGLGYSF